MLPSVQDVREPLYDFAESKRRNKELLAELVAVKAQLRRQNENDLIAASARVFMAVMSGKTPSDADLEMQRARLFP